MMTETIREWISYYAERYGAHYRIRLEEEGKEAVIFYWWDRHRIPNGVLDRVAKRVWTRPCKDEYGISERELEIIF